MQIDLRLLRHARELAEHRSFSRAADALNTSQPTLSRSIKELEERIGLPLFHRSRSGIEPTDFGLVFLEHAVELLARADDLVREVALAKGLQSGEVALGMGPYAAEVLAPICAARFAAAYPSVRLRVISDSPATLARLLRARTVDVVVAEASILGEGEDLEVLDKLAPLPAFAIARVGHPLGGRANVDFAEVLDYPYAQVMMLPPRLLKPILAAKQLARKLGGSAAPPFPAIECPTIRLAVSIVAGSNAFTFATLGMVRAELEQGRIVPLMQPPWLRAEWSIVRLRKRTLSPAMSALVDELKRAHANVLRDEAMLRGRWGSPGESGTPPKSRQAGRKRASS